MFLTVARSNDRHRRLIGCHHVSQSHSLLNSKQTNIDCQTSSNLQFICFNWVKVHLPKCKHKANITVCYTEHTSSPGRVINDMCNKYYLLTYLYVHSMAVCQKSCCPLKLAAHCYRQNSEWVGFNINSLQVISVKSLSSQSLALILTT